MVRKAGLEPAWLAPPPPQDGVSANSTTSAFQGRFQAPGCGAWDLQSNSGPQPKALAELEMPEDSELGERVRATRTERVPFASEQA